MECQVPIVVVSKVSEWPYGGCTRSYEVRGSRISDRNHKQKKAKRTHALFVLMELV